MEPKLNYHNSNLISLQTKFDDNYAKQKPYTYNPSKNTTAKNLEHATIPRQTSGNFKSKPPAHASQSQINNEYNDKNYRTAPHNDSFHYKPPGYKQNTSARRCCENRDEIEDKFNKKNSEQRRRSKLISLNSKLKFKQQQLNYSSNRMVKDGTS